jgi:N-acetyl-beta-hexosaminidase
MLSPAWDRIAVPVGGWVTFRQETAGASLSRHGRTCVPSHFHDVHPKATFSCGSSFSSRHHVQAYTFDPLANLSTAQAKLVLGGQQLLWTEQSGPQNLDSIVWPRAAASAEVFWTGPGGDVRTALPRLHELGYRFRRRGVHAISLQPEWCALRPFACDLDA